MKTEDALTILRRYEGDYFVVGFDRTKFQNDARTIYAVTRCLEIIFEASRRLPDDLKARHSLVA